MNKLINNLKILMELKGLNAYDLEKTSGVSQPTINRILNGKHGDPRTPTVKRLANALGISEMQLRVGAWEDKKLLESTKNVDTIETTRKVPLISWVSAGEWCEAIDNYSAGDAENWLPCPDKCSNHTYALRVKGDSMTSLNAGERSYPNGSIIYVDPEEQVTNGKRVIAKINTLNEVTFKTYKEDMGEKWLMPINPQYDKKLIDDTVTICGVIIGSYLPE